MIVKILNPKQFRITISDKYILCTLKDGYAVLELVEFDGEVIKWLEDIEDINTLSQALDVVYEEYTSKKYIYYAL